MRIVLGTRGSELALTQSGLVADALRVLGHEVELRTVKTHGDVESASLVTQGGLGVFAAALRQALLDGGVDIAVHSFKDLPTAENAGLVVAAVPERADHRDVLVSPGGLSLIDLPLGARVGTGSPRRAAQVRARRPDLTVVEIRGNVGTRLARALGDPATGREADLDAVVLAAAGLARLGRDVPATPLDLLPAPAQGALAVECRAGDAELRAALAALDDPATRFAALAERQVLAELGAGCAAPVGALCTVAGPTATLSARVLDASGHASAEASVETPASASPEELGRRVAAALLAAGAASVTALGEGRDSQLEDFHDDQALWAPGTTTDLVGRHILLPRADGSLADAVRAAGADVTCAPLTRTLALPFPPRLPRGADWLVLTSSNSLKVLVESGFNLRDIGFQIAAVGPATRAAVVAEGFRVGLTPEGSASADDLARAFPSGSGRVVIPGSAQSKPALAEALRAKGWTVVVIPIYSTAPVSRAPAAVARAWSRGDFDAVVVTAGSVASAVLELLGPPPERTRVVAFGKPSAAAATDLGLEVAATAATQDGPGLVGALTRALGKEH